MEQTIKKVKTPEHAEPSRVNIVESYLEEFQLVHPVKKPTIKLKPSQATKPTQMKNSHVAPSANMELPFSGTPVQIPGTHIYHTLSRTQKVQHVTNFKN